MLICFQVPAVAEKLLAHESWRARLIAKKVQHQLLAVNANRVKI